ncbi:hypothetical protein HEK616_53790 [Streptomyces nigrescens]|uniref:Uncharacterized protein n=1 Tax=Streptomyces nigrescens TaxID=1920 RepID=A0ABM7ZZU6_STRNI|nr:hypothetical protein HEK616_53790 [Streptomyces nigrescens]
MAGTGDAPPEPLVVRAQRTVRRHLPGEHGEQQRAEEQHGPSGERARKKVRPPRNRGGGSEAAALTGVPRAPGGMGRADIRSVRIPGAPLARGTGFVREGTAWPEPGKRRPGVARSPLRAGCFSHLQKPYGTGSGPDSRITRPPSAPHIFFTRHLQLPASARNAVIRPGC